VILPVPKILKLPADGTSAPPEFPVIVDMAPEAETAWNDGRDDEPVLVKTNPEVAIPVVALCRGAVVVVPPHTGA
jgi:hypothetical protein